MAATDFSRLVTLDPDEVVTHSFVRDVTLPSGKVLALVTLDNGRDHTRPNTLGPATLLELQGVLEGLAARAAKKEIAAVGVTGKPFILAAGADLSKVDGIPDLETGVLMAKLGHATLGKLSDLGVPSFVFVNGLALGGGAEIALNATYRTIDSSTPAFALPEVFLGLVPGWGGAWILPNLIGIENALEVMISNPLKNNRMLKGPQAFELGIADAMFGPANFLEDSLKWADGVLGGSIKVKRKNEPGKLERAVKWDIAVGIAEKTLKSRIGTVADRPVQGARAAQGGEEHRQGDRIRRRGRGARRADLGRPVPRVDLRVQPGAEARQEAGRRARQGARPPRQQGRRRGRRTHGHPVRAAVRAPAAGAGRHHRPRSGARRQGRRDDPRRDRRAARQGPHRLR